MHSSSPETFWNLLDISSSAEVRFARRNSAMGLLGQVIFWARRGCVKRPTGLIKHTIKATNLSLKSLLFSLSPPCTRFY